MQDNRTSQFSRGVTLPRKPGVRLMNTDRPPHMGWIAQNNRQNTTAHPKSLSDKLLATGSLVFELDFTIASTAPCKLVHYQTSKDWMRRFTVYLNADYSISAEAQQGCATSYVRLAPASSSSFGKMRLTYSWDAPKRHGLLSLENLETGFIQQAPFDTPLPLPSSDATNIILGAENCQIDERVLYLALSDKVETVGPAPTIGAGALVETDQGPRPIERLQLGDMVLTQSGVAQPIRWIMKQVQPTLGRFAPILLQAPFFGLTSDIAVAHDQQVMISGTETEYNFGQDAVLVKAGNLIGHPGVTPLNGLSAVTYYQILLDQHECIRLSGAWADSLFIGQLASSPQVVASTGLASIATPNLPRHHRRVHPELQGYETQALLGTMIS